MKGIISGGPMYSRINYKTVIELTLDENVAREIESLKGKQVEVTIKQYRKGRSLDANGYFWVLAGKLAEAMNIPKTDIYRGYIKEIGGNSEIVCVQDCKAVGIETKTPGEIDNLLSLWARGEDDAR